VFRVDVATAELFDEPGDDGTGLRSVDVCRRRQVDVDLAQVDRLDQWWSVVSVPPRILVDLEVHRRVRLPLGTALGRADRIPWFGGRLDDRQFRFGHELAGAGFVVDADRVQRLGRLVRVEFPLEDGPVVDSVPVLPTVVRREPDRVFRKPLRDCLDQANEHPFLPVVHDPESNRRHRELVVVPELFAERNPLPRNADRLVDLLAVTHSVM